MRNEFLSAQAQERSLAAALEAQKADALSLNRKGIEYGVLRREAESNKQMYEALHAARQGNGHLRRTEDQQHPRSSTRPRFRAGPIRPNKSRDLLLGLLGGLMAGIGLAFFVEYLDNRVKNPDEIKQFLGLELPGPGAGRCARRTWQTGQSPLITEPVPQNFAEAFRAIRTNVLFSSAGRGFALGAGDEHAAVGGQDGGGGESRACRWRRRASACCSSTRTCASRASTSCST